LVRHAYLFANDPSAARDAFQAALEIVPSNGRALLGLQTAHVRAGNHADAELLRPRLKAVLLELVNSSRRADAAMLSLDVADGASANTSRTLAQLLELAPHGQAGWTIPIDGALTALRSDSSFEQVLEQLCEKDN
jgi:cytochrome c-type biogenesis protein CcmH/NrfG